MNKTPAGQPKVKVSNGRLQIVFTYQQQRKYLSLGTSDSKRNQQDAETVSSLSIVVAIPNKNNLQFDIKLSV
jgi:hypothetical protein